MDHYEFIDMCDRDKAFAIWHYGVFLVERRSRRHKIKLYAINDFFVEAFYKLGQDEISEINSFECLEFLDPYLDRITLDELIAV